MSKTNSQQLPEAERLKKRQKMYEAQARYRGDEYRPPCLRKPEEAVPGSPQWWRERGF